jgi:hypothetical protein
MKIIDVHLHTRVSANYVTRDRAKYTGEIVSEEIKKTNSCAQFEVLVKYEKESSARWVAGGNLVKIDF